jgi:hypothetical protein
MSCRMNEDLLLVYLSKAGVKEPPLLEKIDGFWTNIFQMAAEPDTEFLLSGESTSSALPAHQLLFGDRLYLGELVSMNSIYLL